MEAKRVRYEKSPLVEVIFQLRFPTILSINARQPVEFQELIRKQFPFYEEGIEQQNEFLITPAIGQAQVKTSQNKNYSFVSADNSYKVNLTSTFIAVSTLNYTQWEHFKEKIEYVISIFEKVYEPAFYTRVGLRYIDVIERSSIGLNERKWTELVQPHVLGIVANHEEGINSYVSEAEFKDPNDGIGTKTHFEFVHANGNEETSLLIDCDYFKNETVPAEKMIELADSLHTHSSSFLRTAIKDDLHNAMQPVEIS